MAKHGKSAVEAEKSVMGNNQQVEKKKRVRRKREVDDDIQPDSNAEDDTEEDKADLLLSQAFTKKEKSKMELSLILADVYSIRLGTAPSKN